MNAAAGNGDTTEVEHLRTLVSNLQEQRAALLAEVSRLRAARNEAIRAAAEMHQEITHLRARIAELEGDA